MMTYSLANADRQGAGRQHPCQDGVEAFDPDFTANALPVYGQAFARQPAGLALSYAHDEADACGQDRFALLVVDGEGAVIARLGPFCEEEVVATWRDCAAKSGLPRMILREDGVLAPVSRQIGRIALGMTRQRRRVGLLSGRRPRFLVRRKTARLPARPQIHRGEKEIIARS